MSASIPESAPDWLREPPEEADWSGHMEGFGADGAHVGVVWDLRERGVLEVTRAGAPFDLDARFLVQLSRGLEPGSSIERAVRREIPVLYAELRQQRERLLLKARVRDASRLEGLPWMDRHGGSLVPQPALERLVRALLHTTQDGALAGWREEDTRAPEAREPAPDVDLQPRDAQKAPIEIELQPSSGPGLWTIAAMELSSPSIQVSFSITFAMTALMLVLEGWVLFSNGHRGPLPGWFLAIALVQSAPFLWMVFYRIRSLWRQRKIARDGRSGRATIDAIKTTHNGTRLEVRYHFTSDWGSPITGQREEIAKRPHMRWKVGDTIPIIHHRLRAEEHVWDWTQPE